MNKLVILFTFLFVFSCAQKKQNQLSFETVDIDVVDPVEDTPDIDPGSKLGEYGPIGNIQNFDSSKKMSFGVVFGPGLYASIAGLEIISCLERSEINFQTISGYGFSSIVASMYSMGLSLEKIKWLLTNHARDLEADVYSGPWIKSWEKFIRANIEHKKIKLSTTSLWLPDSNDSFKLRSKFSLNNELFKSLNIKNRDFVLKKKIDYIKATRTLPVDKIIFINFLNRGIKMNKLSEFSKGLVRKALSNMPTKESDSFLIYNARINSLDDMSSVQITNFNNMCEELKSKIE